VRAVRELVEALCSDRCAGRAAGSEGGRIARGLVVDALRDAGLDPEEQLVPKCRGANVLATIPGDLDRFVLVAAHYDHLGTEGRAIFRGADDNAAAVGILVEVARALAADRPRGRGVIVAAFDAEEPPYFMTNAMGSQYFVTHPIVPIDDIDLVVCLELVGHAVGEPHLPAEVRRTVFALGGERSVGTRESIELLATADPGVIVRPADAEIIPPLSDYAPFWERKRPFVLLTNGRSRVYHTPNDRPELLDWTKMRATARWLERFVRDQCARHEAPFQFRDGRHDVSTLDSIAALLAPLAPASETAAMGAGLASRLRGQCLRDGSLPRALQGELASLVEAIESGLA
jgi:hypothetical protein